MLQALSIAYCMAPMVSNYGVVNLSNLYNFLISIISASVDIKNEEKEKEKVLCGLPTKDIVQLIKLHLGLTIFEGLKQYALKKYPPSHIVVLALNTH